MDRSPKRVEGSSSLNGYAWTSHSVTFSLLQGSKQVTRAAQIHREAHRPYLVTVLEEGEQRLLNCVPIHLPEDVMRLFD